MIHSRSKLCPLSVDFMAGILPRGKQIHGVGLRDMKSMYLYVLDREACLLNILLRIQCHAEHCMAGAHRLCEEG